VATPPTPDTQPNTLDIDFAALAASRSDPTLASLDRYFGAADPTYQNDYTGAFKGKNIIWIVAESFSSWALDETHTPTLYNLAHSGFVFTNYYAPLWGVSTSDGEYTQLTGLLPKANVWSMAQSADNSLPFSFGNQLSEQGYRSLAFHDGTYTYYDRNRSLPNLGYDFSAVGHGLDLPSADLWPASDVDMIDASADRYLGQGPFNIYYLTISGHMYYTFGGDAMAAKHEADVADLPYSEGPRAYIAAQMEFDQAVKDLIDRLKAAGELDNTVLVISGDHYPYGLTTSDIDELAGHAVDQSFGLYHSSLIIWSGDMTTPVVVDKPCYSVDILPTLSNLFGLPYDSRLLMGHDILSDAAPLVIFANHSWLTDKGRFDASTDAFTPEPGADFGSETPADYARRMMSEVNQRFAASAAVLDKDYYRQVLG
jgi:phosphoglycerol transferase MdoB-like AlkP superfamily enzyme